MRIPTTLNQPLELTFDIRDDESTSITFEVLDDSIPIPEGVPTNTFRWIEELQSLRGVFSICTTAQHSYDRRFCFGLVVHVCATAHLTNWVC